MFVLVSQPFDSFMSQLPNPALQVKPQLPNVQVRVALVRAGHTVPQPPQLSRCVFVLISQPSAPLELQSWNAPVHV